LNRYFVIYAIVFALLMGLNLFGQSRISVRNFDSVYDRASSCLANDTAGAAGQVALLMTIRGSLSDLQQARLDFLWLQFIEKDHDRHDTGATSADKASSSFHPPGSPLRSARWYLERSLPDRAIPLLMKHIGNTPKESDDTDQAMIELSEAYRQKQEYSKAMGILYDLLMDQQDLSDYNRAYTWNRLAALYNESAKPAMRFSDSVIKYSMLCLDLAGNTSDTVNLATSQNELSYQYILRKEFNKALDMSVNAVSNFRAVEMPFHAMNALINLSIIYLKLNNHALALNALHEATAIAPIWENRNLYLRIYRQYANVYASAGDYRSAYGFILLVNRMQQAFFTDRMDSQIVEQSARFDLYVKEQKIREEQKKNEFTHYQNILLVIILIVITISFILSVFYFKLKRKDLLKQKLIEAVADTENNERRRIASDLHDGLGPVLSAINHYFQAYLDAAADKKEAIQERLQQVITEAIDEVSRISHNISPYVLEKYGLITALNNLFGPLIANGKYEITFNPGPEERFDKKKELTLYRCITELLNNTMKHAEATRINLDIRRTGESLHIVYSDNGKGIDANSPNREGMGLTNIANRVESFGGHLIIESIPDKGITVQITMPL
jgi:signal transduction histidine kinase